MTGWAALRLAGANFFDGLEVGRTRIPVLLAVGADAKVRGDGAATVTREPLAADEVVVRHGVPCTRVIRALFDEMRRIADLREAVVAMDMAAAADHRSARRHSRDVAREEAFRRIGLEYVKVSGPDLPRRELVVDRVLGARSRAQFLPPNGPSQPWSGTALFLSCQGAAR